MEEIWKDIEGYKGKYQVSNYGRVKSFVANKHRTESILKHSLCTAGYLKVQLSNKGKIKQIMVHRLVANAFIPNLDNKRTVNHIDGNKHNNMVSNLEWCSYSENMKHAYDNGLNHWVEGKGKKSIPVLMIDKNTNEVLKEFKSIGEATRYFSKKHPSSIIACLKGKQITAHGYKWKQKESEE